ncbi:MAG: hypothetical protein GY788_02170 [bacterium]|nr:hypothetical protein [bacterium]
MQTLADYFGKMDGTVSWTDVEPLFNAAMHDDCVFVTADGEVTKDKWAGVVKGFLEKGVVASDYEPQPVVDGAFHYRVKLTLSDGTPMQLAAKGYIKDGKIVRVEPIDPEAYAQLARGG